MIPTPARAQLILESAVGPLPWPDPRTRRMASLLFGPPVEAVTWALVHGLVRLAPGVGLRLLLRDLTSKPIGPVLAALEGRHRAVLVELFTRMRSGSGFRNDLKFLSPAPTGHPRGDGGGDDPAAGGVAGVSQPTLVIATRNDAAVAFEHAQALTEAIAHARLITSSADSHFIWFGADYPAVAATITEFLTAPAGQLPRP